MSDAVGTPTLDPPPPREPAGEPTPPPEEPKGKHFKFPTAFTVLAIVLLLVWIASFFVPAGVYKTDATGSPVPGTYYELPSCSAVAAGGDALVVESPGEAGVAPADAAHAPGATTPK